jgi:tellurite resistance protein
MNETVAYLIEILMDDLGMDPDEAIEILAETAVAIAKQSGETDALETAANILADA